MLTLVFSILLTTYLIVPEAIFRTLFGYFIPTKNFVLTRTETAYRAVLVTLLPFSLALIVTWYFPVARSFPFGVGAQANGLAQRRADYKAVFAGLYSDTEFKDRQAEFWPALTRCIRRQARTASWYFLFVALEALAMGWLALRYARFKKYRVYRWLADRILFLYLSEWLPLLTPYVHLLPGTVVQADVLCTNDTLYQGIVVEYFLQDGKLSGLILDQPKRFDRKLYLKDKEQDLEPDKNDYWVAIPSENMYFFADKIVNMNLTYIPAEDSDVSTEAVNRFIREVLRPSLRQPASFDIFVSPLSSVKKGPSGPSN